MRLQNRFNLRREVSGETNEWNFLRTGVSRADILLFLYAMENLEEIRKKIDETDARMRELFGERMSEGLGAAQWKAANGVPIHDPAREEEIILKGAAQIDDPVLRTHYIRFQRELIKLCREYQEQEANGNDLEESLSGSREMNLNFKRKLPIPKSLKELYPISADGARAKAKNDAEIREILTGRSDRMLLVIGPCSADREDAVLEYITRLRAVQEKVADRIKIVPRLYTTKPRTSGEGYKGMLHQPDPIAHEDMLEGLIATRRLHRMVLNETGFSCADEMLYPEQLRFLSDLLSYVAVGARSVENQQHRLTASGLNVPVGMKNPVRGDLNAMVNAIHTAQTPQTFIYRNWEVESQGNELAHAVLRGFTGPDGKDYANCGHEGLTKAAELIKGLKNPAIIVDTNHSNSGKKPLEQGAIAKKAIEIANSDHKIKSVLKGFMIESYLEDGCQKPGGTEFGKSITDPCLGWGKTEKLIFELVSLW